MSDVLNTCITASRPAGICKALRHSRRQPGAAPQLSTCFCFSSDIFVWCRCIQIRLGVTRGVASSCAGGYVHSCKTTPRTVRHLVIRHFKNSHVGVQRMSVRCATTLQDDVAAGRDAHTGLHEMVSCFSCLSMDSVNISDEWDPALVRQLYKQSLKANDGKLIVHGMYCAPCPRALDVIAASRLSILT